MKVCSGEVETDCLVEVIWCKWLIVVLRLACFRFLSATGFYRQLLVMMPYVSVATGFYQQLLVMKRWGPRTDGEEREREKEKGVRRKCGRVGGVHGKG